MTPPRAADARAAQVVADDMAAWARAPLADVPTSPAGVGPPSRPPTWSPATTWLAVLAPGGTIGAGRSVDADDLGDGDTCEVAVDRPAAVEAAAGVVRATAEEVVLAGLHAAVAAARADAGETDPARPLVVDVVMLGLMTRSHVGRFESGHPIRLDPAGTTGTAASSG